MYGISIQWAPLGRKPNPYPKLAQFRQSFKLSSNITDLKSIGLVVPSEESQSKVLEERGISPFFTTNTIRKVIVLLVLSYYEQYR